VGDLPATIGKYRILGQAGRGAMGTVYLGHDPVIDRKVAIKVYRLDGAGERDAELARKLFYNEARSAGALDHPNILRVFDAGEVEGEPYIVMEYVPGGDTLRRYCEPTARLDPERVARLVAQVARALHYAHEHGVTHRDVKPANILLSADGAVKVGDFGVALREQATASQTLGPFGSPRYVAPEQARGQAATPRSDLYSLGVVLYELLAGRPPFAAGSLSGLVYKVLYEEPPPLEDLRPDLPAALLAVVRRCLQKDPVRRFATGREVAEALEAVFQAEEPAPVAPSAEQLVKTLARLRFFRDFGEAEVGEVARAGKWQTYAAGDPILQEGSQENAFYVLVSGAVVVTKAGQEIGRGEAGDCFGEMGYLSRGPRSATVTARGGVACLKVSGSLTEWASLPCQLRLSRAFQQTLIDRLARTSEALARQSAG
jgi:serine/threonine-protein kinase